MLFRSLKQKYPRQENEDENMYLKAIKARGFDSLRGFLPAGITTQLSWHSNLRQAWDHLALLRHHPLEEVRDTANAILKQLKEKYAHSFSHPINEDTEKYRAAMVAKYNYYLPETAPAFTMRTSIDPLELAQYQDAIDARSLKTGLPNFLGDLGTISFDFLLDFGSFRDLQRHRAGICRMPLLTTKFGFNEWYLEQLPEDTRLEAQKLIAEQILAIEKLDTTPEIKQYYTAIGFNVACRVSYPLPAALYVIELRSGRAVHPTLRQVAHKMHAAVIAKFPNLKLQSDLSLDDWDVRRGSHDIVTK